MRSPVRLGAVDYLNARPLVYGLELQSDRFLLRFDPPSKCAALLHEGSIDVGMIPSIEYLRGHAMYAVAPGMAIASDGPVASVAVFTQRPIEQVLCYEAFGVDPEFVPMPPRIDEMLQRCDAALLIGDPALYEDAAARGVVKIDLGERWTGLTGLPFVWAFWAGRPGALSRDDVAALSAARDAGVAASDAVADAYCGPARSALGRTYLRDNVRYSLGEREQAGLAQYYRLAEKHGVVEKATAVTFYPGPTL